MARINKSPVLKIDRSSQYISDPSVIKSRKGYTKKSSGLPEGPKELQNSKLSVSMRSILNFHPDDIIANKIERSKKSGTNSSILKTFVGLETKGVSPLPLVESFRRLKNKRQLSEQQILMVSQEMRRIFHKHHFSSGDWEKYFKGHPNMANLNDSQIKKLECLKESEFFREVSQFMDPKDIISMFSIDKRGIAPSPDRKDNDNFIQLSTLSTNPQKREQSKKRKYEESYNNLHKGGNIELEENFDDYSERYEDVLLDEEEPPQGGPNEAMYIKIEKIPVESMLTFEESLQRQKEILDKSAKINNYFMPIWDTRKHAKLKFYKNVDNTEDETKDYPSSDLPKFTCKDIHEISEKPEIMTKDLNPSKIIMGKLKSSISFA
mmetsp:Transcript_38069/g.37568  ORF Transcript_38069/g.37568 Transcript_38069/m.37568 type:complete len:378 (-) Transcript_38069:1639-2772(-)